MPPRFQRSDAFAGNSFSDFGVIGDDSGAPEAEILGSGQHAENSLL